jgi:hypothetical protein
MQPPDVPKAEPSPEPTRADERRPYCPPVLTEYGSIAKLTRSGGSTSLEGASGKNKKF